MAKSNDDLLGGIHILQEKKTKLTKRLEQRNKDIEGGHIREVDIMEVTLE